MRFPAIHKYCLLILAVALLAGCSRDPNVRKQKYLNSGEKYFNKGKFQEAIIEYRNALDIDPRFAAAHYQLARAYMSSRNPDAAYRELQETVTIEPKNSDAQLELASLLVSGRQFDQAQVAAKKVL